MARWSKVADFLQKSITFSCMAGTVYLLILTGRNYLALREKRLANAALIEGQTQPEGSPAGERQKAASQVGSFCKYLRALYLYCF